MATILGLLICLVCCWVVLALFKFFLKYWWVPMRIKYVMKSQGINGPRYDFIHGNTKEISRMRKESMSLPMEISHYTFPRIQPHFDLWFRVYGKNFLYWLGPQPALVVTEPELLKEIMSDREILMVKQGVGPIFKKIFGQGLTTSNGDTWAIQRKLANQAFHAERLKNMAPAMIESVDMMLKRWKDIGVKEMDVYKEFKILTSEVISRTAFGSSYEEGKQVFHKLGMLNLLANQNLYRVRLPVYRKVFKHKDDVESDKLHAEIQDIIMQMIRSRQTSVISGDGDKSTNDYLGLLLKAHHDKGENSKLSIQDVIDECKTFYTVGHITISLLLSWATLLLGIHTEWQQKAREEVQEVFGEQNPSSEGITRLKTMGMIINETLRLYPPGVTITRKILKEMKVGNLVFPANINVQIPAFALQQDPKIWGEDAHLFKPERFSEGVAKATKNNPGAFRPFGYGPRNCVGSSFAINEAKIVLSMILQRYRFTHSPSYIHAPVQIVTLCPKHGVQVILQAL